MLIEALLFPVGLLLYHERNIKDMNIDMVVSLIGSVGFPIVACVAMGAFYATQFKDFQNMLNKNNILTEELVALLRKEEKDDAEIEQPLH